MMKTKTKVDYDLDKPVSMTKKEIKALTQECLIEATKGTNSKKFKLLNFLMFLTLPNMTIDKALSFLKMDKESVSIAFDLLESL